MKSILQNLHQIFNRTWKKQRKFNKGITSSMFARGLELNLIFLICRQYMEVITCLIHLRNTKILVTKFLREDKIRIKLEYPADCVVMHVKSGCVLNLQKLSVSIYNAFVYWWLLELTQDHTQGVLKICDLLKLSHL